MGWRKTAGTSELLSSAIIQVVYDIKNGLNWYCGPAAQLLFYVDLKSNLAHSGVFGPSIKLGGQFGIEYHVKGKPIIISIDTRPMMRFIKMSIVYIGLNASLRYTFGS